MDRLGSAVPGRLDDRRRVQVALRGLGGTGPIRTAWSASLTKGRSASASEYTATALIPIVRAVRITRRAISPRFATSTDSSISKV